MPPFLGLLGNVDSKSRHRHTTRLEYFLKLSIEHRDKKGSYDQIVPGPDLERLMLMSMVFTSEAVLAKVCPSLPC